MAFNIPIDQPEHWKVDAWRTALDQAPDLYAVIELEGDLNRRIAWAAKRSFPMPYAPELLALVARRWNEIAAGLGMTLRRKS